jgi:uncharacterized protein (DUF924 family)
MAAMNEPEPALNPPARPAATPQEVLAFWFDAAHESFWFEKSEAFDRLCVAALLPAHERATAGALAQWRETAEGSLSLVLLLDQLPRNAFRGEPRAFASDALARAVARHALAAGHDLAVDATRRLFLYLPFEHSEDLADQFLSEALFATLGSEETLFYATRHREIVERFGRFPHRNAALGRDTTAEERAFLAEPHSSF